MKISAEDNILLAVTKRLQYWKEHDAAIKVWNHDPTVWKEKPEDDVELSDRLGWLNLPSSMKENVSMLNEFAEEIRKEFDDVVLLGMGGSSLAPEVFFKTFGKRNGYPSLTVLDSTHPLSVLHLKNKLNLKKTLFITSSKSGGTTETMSFYLEFYNALGDNAGNNFVAVTDKGSGLEKIAREKKFRKIFTTPSDVGGRYSAMTYFGLLPAALIGADVEKLLARAEEMEIECRRDTDVTSSGGFKLGALLGECAVRGIDKLTFFVSPGISAFPVWIEQLIAESTGKEGKGILPVEGEEAGDISIYTKDRLFAYIKLENENSPYDKLASQLRLNEFAVVEIEMHDVYDICKEMYRWEIATAMAGSILRINPFNQPNVQLAKTLASESMSEYTKNGKLPELKAALEDKGVKIYGQASASSVEDCIKDFLGSKQEGSYAALMAFLPQTKVLDDALNELRLKIRDKYHIPVTVGFGPRFLHSTGQLHKGDGDKGLFLQFTGDISDDLEVPGKGYSFGTLITAQAMGDMKALQNSGKNVLSLHFSGSSAEKIRSIAAML
jgi:transaldolase/glucose-6-phosphate isomerase